MGDGRGGSAPSPLVPCLIIGLLIAATCGPSLFNSAAFLSEMDETTVTFVYIIPLLTILMIYYVSESVIIPLVVLLLVYFLRRMVMGPLILLLIIHVLSYMFPIYNQGGSSSPPLPPPPHSSYYSTTANYSYYSTASVGGEGGRSSCNGEGEGYGWGWGSFWLLLVFLVLLKMYSN